MDEDRLRRGLTTCFEEIERTDRVDVEILERA